MDIIDVDFTVQDAQNIVVTSKQKKEFVFYKFHHAIIRKIKQRAENRYFNVKYTIPIYLFGQQMYNVSEVLFWLVQRLQRDGFHVIADYESRSLFISWKPEPEVKSVSKGRGRRRSTTKKNVSFNLDKNLYFNY